MAKGFTRTESLVRGSLHESYYERTAASGSAFFLLCGAKSTAVQEFAQPLIATVVEVGRRPAAQWHPTQ
jgi:hypothetical protein